MPTKPDLIQLKVFILELRFLRNRNIFHSMIGFWGIKIHITYIFRYLSECTLRCDNLSKPDNVLWPSLRAIGILRTERLVKTL
jgi:hypothetical protein